MISAGKRLTKISIFYVDSGLLVDKTLQLWNTRKVHFDKTGKLIFKAEKCQYSEEKHN